MTNDPLTYTVIALLAVSIALQVAATWMRVRTEQRTQRLLLKFEQALRDATGDRL